MARTPMNGPRNARPRNAPPAPAVPSILQGLMTAPPVPPASRPGTGLAGAMSATRRMPPVEQTPYAQLPSYQMGGAVGPGGMPQRPPGMQAQPVAGLQQQANPQEPLSPQMIEMQIQDVATRNPQVLAQIRQAINEAIMSGELTQQELNMMVQLATTAMRNPALYPQIRQFAIQQGIATEQDLSPTYDQGLIIAILAAAQAAQADVGGQNMMAGGTPAMAGAAPIQSMKDGGRVKGNASEPVVIEAHTGEYVIPKHVVDMKGREFFDRMLEQYAEKARNDG
jgi:hypothetical protein